MFRIVPRAIFSFAALASPFAAIGAQLDFTADAVIGKPGFSTVAGGALSATNLGPVLAVAEDPVSGALWVADDGNRVLRFSSAAGFTNGEAANLVLGQADFTSSMANRGGAVAANTLSRPAGLGVDQAGRLYVSDSFNHRVLVFVPPFTNGMAAKDVIGQANFTSSSLNRGLTTAQDSLASPGGLAVDSTGNLFVADGGNGRVLRFTGPAVTGAAASGLYGKSSYTVNSSQTDANGLGAPVSLSIDAQNGLWVADAYNRVLHFNAGNTTANVVLCQSTFTGIGNGGNDAASCVGPTHVAVDAEGFTYVFDYGNNRILRFAASPAVGASAVGVIGQSGFNLAACNRGLPSPTEITLCSPQAGIIDRNGDLLVGEAANARVLRYDLPRARIAPTIASLSPEFVPRGTATFTLTVNGGGFYGTSTVNWNGAPRATQFLSSQRLVAQIPAADVATGSAYSVSVTTPAPGGGTSTTVDFLLYVRASLDGAADRVLFQPNFASTTALNPQVGEEQVGVYSGANVPFSATRSVAIDPVSGRLFVVDSGRGVLSWPNAASFFNAQAADVTLGQPTEFQTGCNVAALNAASMCSPYGVAVDERGVLYVSDTLVHRVLQFVPPFTTGMAATRVYGQGGSFTTGAINKGGRSANSLSSPEAVAASGSALFVYDAGNRRVLAFNNPDLDSTAEAAIGQPDLTSSVIQAASATRFFGADGALLVDGTGKLFFAHTNGNRVLRFSPPFANDMAADLVLGQPDFTATSVGTSASTMSAPRGLAMDPAGNLLVAEINNNRVLRFTSPLASGMAAGAVLGQLDFVSGFGGSTASRFNGPTGLAVDGVGNIYVPDSLNSRLLAFDRPFAVAIDPAGDIDRDGIPNAVEPVEGRDTYTKDNDVFGNARLFAMQQYRDFLGREGDAGGITFYTNAINGGTSRAQVIENFFNSPEFGGIVAPVTRLYFAFFNRIPDYPGLQFQVNAYRTGTPLTVIANNFSLSPEFTATYGSLANTQYVVLLYQNVLGRTPVQAEIDFHVNRLNTGSTRGEVMVGFSESPEYQALKFNAVYVTNMYVGMLRRAPEQAGFDFWVAYMAGGNSGQALIAGFLNAPEYHNRFLP